MVQTGLRRSWPGIPGDWSVFSLPLYARLAYHPGMSMVPWWVCLACVVLALAGSWALGVSYRSKLRSELADAKQKNDEFRNTNTDLRRLAAESQSIAAASTRKFDEQFAAIEGYLNERDLWKETYLRASGEYANAQAMLLEERDRLLLQLRAAGIKPHLSPLVERVTRECRQHPISEADVKRACGLSTGSEPSG